MSVNYDVLKQLHGEFSTLRPIPLVEAPEEVTKTVVSVSPVRLEDSDEMLHLVNQVFFSSKNNAPRIVAFSGVTNDGSSWSVCGRAAQLLALHSSRSVCVVVGKSETKNLTSLLSKDHGLRVEPNGTDIREECTMMGNNLWLAEEHFLTDGRVEMLPLNQLQEKFAALRKAFHYIFIDTPGLLSSEGASVLTQIAGSVILVVEANVTRRRDARRVTQSLQAAGVSLLGTILNNRSSSIPKVLYNKL